MRFLSHHDLMRTFHRALRRAGLPVRHTEGYNPRPRVVLPHALEVGVSSGDEYAEIELSEWVQPAAFERRLGDALPDGIDVLGVKLMPPRRRGSAALEAHYEATLGSADAERAREGAARFMESDSWKVTRPAPCERRPGPGPRTPTVRSTNAGPLEAGYSTGLSKEIDLRPHVIDVAVVDRTAHSKPTQPTQPRLRRPDGALDRVASGSAPAATRRGSAGPLEAGYLAERGSTLRLRLRLGRPGAARPREVIAAVLGRGPADVLAVPLRKTKTVLAGPG